MLDEFQKYDQLYLAFRNSHLEAQLNRRDSEDSIFDIDHNMSFIKLVALARQLELISPNPPS